MKKVRSRIFQINSYYDNRICGRSMAEYIPSIFREDKDGVGMTGSQSTLYPILKRISSHVIIAEKEIFSRCRLQHGKGTCILRKGEESMLH